MTDEIDDALLVTVLQKSTSVRPSIKQYRIRKNVVESGNNYCSEIMKLQVDYEVANQLRTKMFLLKVPSSVPAYDILATNGMYDKETFMYEYVLPRMHAAVGRRTAPKHYHTTDSKSLLLEDLRAAGYVMPDRRKQLNLDESEAILTSLATFHAASYSLQLQNAALVRAVAPETFFNNFDFTKQRLEAALAAWSAIVAEQPAMPSEFVRELPSLVDPILQQLPAILSSNPYEFNVLNHGDLWTSNILFKYDDHGHVHAAKMIDFQNCRWTSPANDIILFATTSVRFDIFDRHFDELLRVYVQTLNKTLSDLGHAKVYTEKQLRHDLEKAKLFRIVILAVYLNVTLAEPDAARFFKIDGDQLNMENIDGTYLCEHYKLTMAKWLRYLDKHRLY